MGYSRESASDKLRRGQTLLASGTTDDANLGTALIALHGALEDRLRELLASRLPARREEIIDVRSFQWKDILALAEQHLDLSKVDSEFISQANIYRTTFAHSGNLRWNRDGIRKYEELICLLWATGSRTMALSGTKTSVSSIPLKPVTSPASLSRQVTQPRHTAMYHGLPGIQIEDRPWYRSAGWYWVFFLFALPVWAFLTLTDKQRGKLAKFIAFLLFFVLLTADAALLNYFGILPLPAIIGGVTVEVSATSQPTAKVMLTQTPRAAQPGEKPSPTAAAAETVPASVPVTAGTQFSCDLAWEEYPGDDMGNKNRAMVWTELVSRRVSGSGMKPEQFFQLVVEQNPQLKTDGYVFMREKNYLLPRCR